MFVYVYMSVSVFVSMYVLVSVCFCEYDCFCACVLVCACVRLCLLRWCFYLLCFAFVGSLVLVVDATEVGDNDRNRKCDDEHSAQRTYTADDLTNYRIRNHITIPITNNRNTPYHHTYHKQQKHCI